MTWQFTYTGFFDELAVRFLPNHVLSGEFTGEDRNRDSTIDADELTSMLIYGDKDYKQCTDRESPYHVRRRPVEF
jgi:hypothetical protein